MHRFVTEKNIEHFKLLLAKEADETRKAMLRRMIREEEAKLAELDPRDSGAPAGPSH